MRYYTKIGDEERELRFERVDGRLLAHGSGRGGDRTWHVDLSPVGDGAAFSLLVDGQSHDVLVESSSRGMVVQLAGERLLVEVEDERERAAHRVSHAAAGGRREVRAVMPGVVVEVLVREGQRVQEGDTLLILEAMKMQSPVQAEGEGVIAGLHARKGVPVAGGQLLLVIDSEER